MALFVRLVPAIALIAAVSAGCGTAALAPDHARSAHGLAIRGDDAPKDKSAFLAELQRRGIRLSAAQIAVLADERSLEPSGAFADRPAHDLDAKKNLRVHFKKHGHEFKPAIESEEAYIAQGIAAATGERGPVRYFFDTTSFAKGYQSHIVRWVPKTRDFCAFRADGAMTTYYLNVDVSPKRFIEVPELN